MALRGSHRTWISKATPASVLAWAAADGSERRGDVPHNSADDL